MKALLGSSKPFRLYIHRESGRLIGLCAELRAVIEGSTHEEILAGAKALIAGSAKGSALSRPRIRVRIDPNSRISAKTQTAR